MKTNILPAIKMTIVTIVFFSGVYTAVIWGIGKLAPGGGKGQTVVVDGKKYYTNVGQTFTKDKYFNSRPSAVDYNSAGSGGSNKGPSNPEYLQLVQARIDTFLVHNPKVSKSDIPVELVTASGSGLDPHISEKAALVQISRIAEIRKVQEGALKDLVAKNTDGALMGLLGPKKVNVLELNLALDRL